MHRPARTLALIILLLAPALAWPAADPQRFTVLADGHPLALWAREVPGARGAILLIHGRTWSALPDFDLQVPGAHRSVMLALNAKGYSAFALDLRGYGKSPRDATGWLTPDRAARDVAAALEWLALERHVVTPTLLGWSRGSLVAQLTAQRHPRLISNLVLFGYPRNPALPETLAPAPSEPARELNTRAGAASDFITPEVVSGQLIDAYVAAALRADPVRTDWREQQQFDELDPAKIVTPTLVIHGEHDPHCPIDAQAALFTRLGTADRQWVVLPGADHAALLESSADAFIEAVVAFAGRPRY
jgi:pimeloyl-ACP methyl ester carboxylesterase